MDADYQPLLKQAVELERKFHDLLDQPNNPLAVNVRSQIQGVVSDAKTKRNPREIENRIKVIQQELRNARSQADPMMDTNHMDYFIQNYEQVRNNLHHFQNY